MARELSSTARAMGAAILGNIRTLQSAATATGNGTSVSPSVRTYSLWVSGITTATIVFEGSADGGTTYEQIGSSITADGVTNIECSVPLVRARISAYTSGTITVLLCE